MNHSISILELRNRRVSAEGIQEELSNQLKAMQSPVFIRSITGESGTILASIEDMNLASSRYRVCPQRNFLKNNSEYLSNISTQL